MTHAIGGLYELTVGTTDLAAAQQWWSRFGYSAGVTGELTADEASAIYGVKSAVRSIRLAHGASEHGLIRLMQWEHPAGPGIGAVGLRALGSRWGAALTTALAEVSTHCELADERGESLYWVPSVRQDPRGQATKPFLEPHVFVREMLVARQESRQVLFQRFGYVNPSYGVVVDAAFPTSQVTHAGIVTSGDPEQLFFYERALGLLRTRDGSESTWAETASRKLFELQPGERYLCWDFDDPLSSSDPARWLSGRLKAIHFDESVPLADLRPQSQLGHIGHSSYTWQVRDVVAAAGSIEANNGRVLTTPGLNEFGEPTFRFTAPDGYDWLLIGVAGAGGGGNTEGNAEGGAGTGA
jgi:hypothetical protein